jgi:hypothetical protein
VTARTFVVSMVATVAITLTPEQQRGRTEQEIIDTARDIGLDCFAREEPDTADIGVEEVVSFNGCAEALT